MTDDRSEFEYLAEEAAELGITGALPGVRRVTVPTSTGEISALVWGEHPEFTFLHGGGLNAHTWDSTILALGLSAIAVDLPGHGDSAWRDDFDYSPRANVGAVAAVIDRLGGGVPQTVVGQSLGGVTAIALAQQRPELVRALVVVDVSPGLRPGDATQVTDFLAGPQVFNSRDEIVEKAFAAGIGSSRHQLERGVVLNTRIRDDGKVIFKHHLASPPPGGAFRADFADLWPGLESSAEPVLLVRGSHGFLADDVVDEFRSRVPRADIVQLESGHNVQEQRPAELASEIGRFAAARSESVAVAD